MTDPEFDPRMSVAVFYVGVALITLSAYLLIGWAGVYAVLGVLFIVLALR